VFRGRVAGGWTIAAGLVILAGYAVLVWTGIYGNESATQVCGAVTNPHRDNFFPPYTVCGTGESAIRATSTSASVAGAALFVLGCVVVLVGLTVLVRSRRRSAAPRRG
jgi:drug/metabolite transporter (DMT)-like permease